VGAAGAALNPGILAMNGNQVLGLSLLAVACVFAAGILFRSWRKRRTPQPLVAAILVLAIGAVAIVLSLIGAVSYRVAVGTGFLAALLAVLVSARTERRTP
jgi:peptidoglycan/LPS O-acetylase OafA/YrhL